MVSFEFLSYYLAGNLIIYLLVHIPLDILAFTKKSGKIKEQAQRFPPWPEGKFLVKIITIGTTFLFWGFILCWPILHWVGWDDFLLFFSIQIPYVGEVFQYLGMVFICLGTIIACLGRIARGRKAISWGVPKQLTTTLGFRLVRHPLYASYCYYFLGIPLALLNGLLLFMLPGIIGYYQTAKYEEWILEQEFGEEYHNYQRKVGMIIPFIGRKKTAKKNSSNKNRRKKEDIL
ncbi:MAG: isoprenylcysteine carboxylmethyltransferase family protein [Asgard group archaeon]|nr:isoprenylcysteine carboxylmethyltransferase family protein [Asgard group archaeon]